MEGPREGEIAALHEQLRAGRDVHAARAAHFYPFAADRAEAAYASRVLTILRPDAADEQSALSLFRKLADQEGSFTDCVSFAQMRRYKLSRILTFDRHFAAAGFTVWP